MQDEERKALEDALNSALLSLANGAPISSLIERMIYEDGASVELANYFASTAHVLFQEATLVIEGKSREEAVSSLLSNGFDKDHASELLDFAIGRIRKIAGDLDAASSALGKLGWHGEDARSFLASTASYRDCDFDTIVAVLGVDYEELGEHFLKKIAESLCWAREMADPEVQLTSDWDEDLRPIAKYLAQCA